MKQHVPLPRSLIQLGKAGFLALIGCAAPAKARPYDCVVLITSDPGQALSGVVLTRDGARVGVTTEHGARVSLLGKEGEVAVLDVLCPEGFRSPENRLQIPLKRFADSQHTPEYSVVCAPKLRLVVVAIRANQGASLPVMYLGQPIARTDAYGAAHVALLLPPNSQFELTLATNQPEAARLRPQNPTARFVVPDRDELLALDQPFGLEKAKQKMVVKVHAPIGPVRLN
jgi:hypothetical protein